VSGFRKLVDPQVRRDVGILDGNPNVSQNVSVPRPRMACHRKNLHRSKSCPAGVVDGVLTTPSNIYDLCLFGGTRERKGFFLQICGTFKKCDHRHLSVPAATAGDDEGRQTPEGHR